MARGLLSVKSVQAAKPAEKEYLLSDGDGMFVRVLPTGRKTWQLIYTLGKRRCKLSLGDVADIGLAAARQRAETERARIGAGDDPRVAQLAREADQARALALMKVEAERLKAESLPLEAMVDAWLTNGVSRSDANTALRRRSTSMSSPSLEASPCARLRKVTSGSCCARLVERTGRTVRLSCC